jgi:1-acyl-sn-glycerol-3-phosphate acyltransferase
MDQKVRQAANDAAHDAVNSTAGVRPLGCYGVLSWLAAAGLRAFGWRLEVIDPMPLKCVIIVYPHTSNWDFIVGVASKWAAGFSIRKEALCYASKESLFYGRFAWAYAWFFRAVGGFPVNRTADAKTGFGFVEQMTARFASEPKLRFAIAPEGTRQYKDHIRSSFYYVAKAAQVPILLGVFDYTNKRFLIMQVFTPGDNVQADLAQIQSYYAQFQPRLGFAPHKAAPWRFRERD